MELKKMVSGMPVDTDELTATPEAVLENELFVGHGEDEAQQGEMPNMSYTKGSPTVSVSGEKKPAHRATQIMVAENSEGEKQIALSPPKGFFPGDGMAFVCCRPEELGIDPEKIPVGKTICLIEGTWGADADFSSEDLKEGKIAYGLDGRTIGEGKSYGQVAKTIAAGDTYEIKKGFYEDGKVTAKDLKSQTVSNATEDCLLAGKNAWVNGKKIEGSILNRGSGISTQKSFFYNYNGKIHLVSWIPEGFYKGWQSGEERYAEVLTDKNIIDNLIGKAEVSAMAARGFGVASSDWTTSDEKTFTMPRDGKVYYGGMSACYNASGTVVCEITKNGSVIDSRNIDSNNRYNWRGTMWNRLFAAKKGDVIKVRAACTSGTHAISGIQAVIVY